MHIGRAMKLASAQSLSGVTTAAGGGGGVGAATTAAGALEVSATGGGRGASTFAGLEAALRGRSAGLAGLLAAADAAVAGVSLSMIVSMGSLLAAMGAGGVLSRITSSGWTTTAGTTSLTLVDQLRQPQVAATTVSSTKTPTNIQTTIGFRCRPLPRLLEPRADFLLWAIEWRSGVAGCPSGSRDRRLRSLGFSSRSAGLLSGPHLAVAEGVSSESSSGSKNWVGA